MRIEIIQGGRVLRQFNHEGRSYIEAPPEGAYEIRLTNNSPRQRLAVISVDGINVVDGETAGYDGPGYVLRPWETLNLKGWRRDDSKVAKFTFQPQDQSYSNRTGRGTKNTGIIGVAVFEEKVKPIFLSSPDVHIHHHHHHHPSPWRTFSNDSTAGDPRLGRGTIVSETAEMNNISEDDGSQVFCSTVPCSATLGDDGGGVDGANYGSTVRGLNLDLSREVSESATKSADSRQTLGRTRSRVTRSAEPVELGTGYGKEVSMFTTTTEFERATEEPSQVIVLQYAVTEKLIEWGVPVPQQPPKPEAFPASAGPSVAPPPGWQSR